MKLKYLLGLIIALFLLSRLIFLTSVPIFNDESTYLRFAAHQINEPDHKAYSLKIGKEPLLPYIFGVTGEVSGNYLIAGRLVSVLFGFLTLLGIFYFTKNVFGKKAAFLASIIYIFSPYNLFFDRLALLDSAISTIAVWSLYVTYLLFKFKTWVYSIALGLIMGIGLWIKASSLFYVFLPIISLPFFYIFDKSKKTEKNYIFILLGTSIVIATIFYLLLYSNTFYSEYQLLMKQYTYSFSSALGFPFKIWSTNLSHITQWLIFYMIPIIPILAILYLIAYNKEYKKYYLVLLWFIIPFIYEVLFAKLLTSRHALLLSIPIIILAGAYLSKIKNKYLLYLIISLYLLIAIFYNSFLYLNPQKLPDFYPLEAKSDMIPYFYGFSSGYGVNEAINYIKDLSKNKNIIVVTRNDFGNPEDAIIGSLFYEDNIKLFPINSYDEVLFRSSIDELLKSANGNIDVYFVSRGAFYVGLEKYFKNKKEFKKPNDTEFIGIYKLGL